MKKFYVYLTAIIVVWVVVVIAFYKFGGNAITYNNRCGIVNDGKGNLETVCSESEFHVTAKKNMDLYLDIMIGGIIIVIALNVIAKKVATDKEKKILAIVNLLAILSPSVIPYLL